MGDSVATPAQRSTVQENVSSQLTAEVLSVLTAFHKAVDLEITDFKVFLDNITLNRTINNNDQRKELIGIIYDIRSISSGFTSIFFVHIPLSDSPAKLSLCLAVLNPNLD